VRDEGGGERQGWQGSSTYYKKKCIERENHETIQHAARISCTQCCTQLSMPMQFQEKNSPINKTSCSFILSLAIRMKKLYSLINKQFNLACVSTFQVFLCQTMQHIARVKVLFMSAMGPSVYFASVLQGTISTQLGLMLLHKQPMPFSNHQCVAESAALCCASQISSSSTLQSIVTAHLISKIPS
jgi:hypothetical protein